MQIQLPNIIYLLAIQCNYNVLQIEVGEYGKEEEKTYTQNEIFENFEIQDIRKTDKTGLDQIQDL